MDSEGNIFSGYGAHDGTFYLIRPDRHIAARWATITPGEIETALTTALGG